MASDSIQSVGPAALLLMGHWPFLAGFSAEYSTAIPGDLSDDELVEVP